ncbi:glycosyl hydrolase 115 family protein [Levilactobacillus enshiensis]|uniref:glycosyl hydrolase 115 family protein n=1 Tax=Levilactobacillus enshiensis TaxID=2590213 RepID=UPI00117ABDD3|nr:glycosyl hydrolase 115 family protein [Levilactobacillus enshiensis]
MTVPTFIISRQTTVTTDHLDQPILRNAVAILQRDIQRTTTDNATENVIHLLQQPSTPVTDKFIINYINSQQVNIISATARGLMYGVLAVSHDILGIDDFWYFMDTPIETQPTIAWQDFSQHLPQFRTKYRGWFVNDELLISTWHDHDSSTYVWKRIYETLLRLGGNLIVPGTDKESRRHRTTAQNMGLMITHHHAEPLGAKMFARVYPNLEASYLKHPKLFQYLWRTSILEQRGTPVLYGLGFRGQGDRPFWLEDGGRVWSDADKATVINNVIHIQYDLVHELDPGAPCAINIYGELTALYNKGLLELPNDVIEIWADSGYGKMVSRRQGDINLRSPVLSTSNPHHRNRGIYYHVTFHDLQASNFLTLLPNSPEFVANELTKVRAANFDTLELINVGNIKPHILFIREVARSWRTDYQAKSNSTIISNYVAHYYNDAQATITQLYQDYFQAIIQYGLHDDERIGDEFAPYLTRKLIKAWLGHHSQLDEMNWLTGDVPLNTQLDQINQLLTTGLPAWNLLQQQAVQTLTKLNTPNRQLLYNDLWLSIVTQVQSLRTLKLTITAYQLDQQGQRIHAYLKVDSALCENSQILTTRHENPVTKWADFYDNDAYTNISLTATMLSQLRGYLRILGDGPDEDQWNRQYLMEPADARVMLLSNTHLALTDHVLAQKLREHFSE